MKDISILLKKFLSPEQISTEAGVLQAYGKDWTHLKGRPSLVLFPRNTDEVSRILCLCHEHEVKVVPSGGRTGLAGGAVAPAGEVIVSLDKMSRIIEVDPVSRTLTAEAGVVLQTLQEEAERYGLMYPIHLGSSGSCQLGGNIATNAGGLRFIANGGTREHVLGLKAVMADGTVLDLHSKLRKNNSGLDLKQMFIGTEGTMGIITEATMSLIIKPRETIVSMMGFDHVTMLDRVIAYLNQQSVNIKGFEFLTAKCMELVKQQHRKRSPFDCDHPYYLLIELEGELREDGPAIQSLLGLQGESIVKSVIVAQTDSEKKEIWSLRELISESLQMTGTIYKHDVSLPLSKLNPFISWLEGEAKKAKGQFEIFLFGHVGDGNIHVNYRAPKSISFEELLNMAQPFKEAVFKYLRKHKGSISAEHGIGILKRDDLSPFKDDVQWRLLKDLKNLWDPKGILNPAKLLPHDPAVAGIEHPKVRTINGK